jgi:disulfide bond formation protein DsbB
MGYFALGYGAVNEADLKNDHQTGWYVLLAAWVLVTMASLGSLFFSEVMGVPVCVLCWYQRIAMYPLVVILAIGLFPFDPRVVRYAFVFATAGWLLAFYQLMLIAGVIPEKMQPCVQGVPCSETHIQVLGIFNIPSLSLVTFSAVGLLLFYLYRMEN